MAKRRSRLPLVVTSLVIALALALAGSLYLAYARGTGPFKSLLASRADINLAGPAIGGCSAISDVPEAAAACAANKATTPKAKEYAAKQAAKQVTQKLVEEKLRTKTYEKDVESGNPAASQTAAAAAEVASDLGVTVAPGASSSQIVSQVVDKAVAQPIVRRAITPPTPSVNLDDITNKKQCGSANIPMYSGFTYASGLAADKDGNICNAALEPTTCKYRHCVTWATEGDDQCVRKNVVCGDAYANSPATTVLMLGGAYTLSSNGEQQTLINSCFTKSGDLVPNGTKRNKDTTTTETCVDGAWTTQDKLIAANNKLCEERYPGQGYEYNANFSMCMLSSEAAGTLKASLTPTSSITDETNSLKCNARDNAQWKENKCQCMSGFVLAPTKSKCVSTKPSCTNGTLTTYADNKSAVKNCESGKCNPSGTACSSTSVPAGSYSTFPECATGITPDMRVVCRESTDGKGNKYFYRVPYEIVSTKLSATLYDSEKLCRVRLPSTQDCVPISGYPGKFGRMPKVATPPQQTAEQTPPQTIGNSPTRQTGIKDKKACEDLITDKRLQTCSSLTGLQNSWTLTSQISDETLKAKCEAMITDKNSQVCRKHPQTGLWILLTIAQQTADQTPTEEPKDPRLGTDGFYVSDTSQCEGTILPGSLLPLVQYWRRFNKADNTWICRPTGINSGTPSQVDSQVQPVAATRGRGPGPEVLEQLQSANQENYAPFFKINIDESQVKDANSCSGGSKSVSRANIENGQGQVVYNCKKGGNYVNPATGLAIDGTQCYGDSTICDSGYCRKRLGFLGIDWFAADQCAPAPSSN